MNIGDLQMKHKPWNGNLWDTKFSFARFEMLITLKLTTTNWLWSYACPRWVVFTYMWIYLRWGSGVAVRVSVPQSLGSWFKSQPGTRFSLAYSQLLPCRVVDQGLLWIGISGLSIGNWMLVQFVRWFLNFIHRSCTSVMMDGVCPSPPSVIEKPRNSLTY